MKKLLLILLCLPLLFTTCKKEETTSPESSAAPPACCTFAGTVNGDTLTYNPTMTFGGGVTQTLCVANVSKNSNGDILNISLQFHSFCPGTDKDWTLTVDFNTSISNSTQIIPGQTYNLGNPTCNSPLATFLFTNYNCSQQPISTHMNGPNQSGTVMFDVDWANNEIEGAFTLTGEDGSGILPPKTVSCTFSGLPFILSSF